jgi:acetyl-CoA carboxylase biotin carboxylase subunit
LFKKILVANRGEIAVRVIRACREMGIATVAVYSEADRASLPVLLADETVCIGPGPSKDSYFNIPNVVSAALITGAEAIHPGYGFLSENASFAEICGACGIKFIGPPPDAIAKMGDKATARETMRRAGVPVVPGSDGVIGSESEALRVAGKIGYPVVVKATAGGGGRGIRVVEDEEDLVRVLKIAQAEAGASFGNADVYLEKYIREMRHIEVQVLFDEKNHGIHLHERECSLQTPRHQKVVEEAPSATLTPALRKRMGDAAVKAARAVGYANAGTVEFILTPGGEFYFMEMNTRIQVEHPITEAITGVDLVRWQIRVAGGEALTLGQKEVPLNGHAIECRVTAQDPAKGFAPAAGTLSDVRLPGGLGVRVDTQIYGGYTVPPYYDANLAKIIVWAPDRPAAIARMRSAIAETRIAGVATNLPFLERILRDERYVANQVNTAFLPRLMDEAGLIAT